MPRHYGLPGKVYLTDAGRGPANELSACSVEALQGADVVYYDGPVPEEVLELISARAAVQSAERFNGAQESSREELQKRILIAAQSGQTVVLLRGGNASILERTKEEIAGLFHAGILFEVIPGAAASAAPAAPSAAAARDQEPEIVLQLPPRAELLSS